MTKPIRYRNTSVALSILLVGTGVGWWRAARERAGQSATVAEPTVTVLVAARDLPVGTLLHGSELANQVTTQTLPRAEVPLGSVIATGELSHLILGCPVRAGEPILSHTLIRPHPLVIPAGSSVATVEVVVESGMTYSGARADVLAVSRGPDRVSALPLLIDVPVLGIGSRRNLKCDWGDLLLGVDRKQALLLELARAEGFQPVAVLRGPGPQPGDECYDIDAVARVLSSRLNQPNRADPQPIPAAKD